MASALENLFAAQQLFRPVAESAERISQQRRQEALLNLRRQQELQDQQAAEALRIRLAEMQIGADDRRTNAMYQKEVDRLTAKERADEAKATAAKELLEAKSKEERERIARNAVRTAFANYKKARGTKKLSEFGTETDEGTYYAIMDEMPELERNAAIDTFKGQARVLGQQESALNSLLSLSRDEEKEIFDSSVQVLMMNKETAKAAEFLTSKLADGKQSPDAVMAEFGKRYPQAASALKAQITASRNLRQMEKSQSKEAQQLMRETAQLRSALVEFGGKNRIPEDVFSQISMARDVPRDLATDDQQTGSGLGNLGKVRDQLGAPDPAQAGLTAAPGAADVTSPYGEYGGLKGMIRGIPNMVDSARANYAAYSPQDPFRGLSDGLSFLIGGRRQLQEAQDQRAQEAAALNALVQRRRAAAQPSDYAPVVLDALLRSRQPTQPPVNPFVFNR